jgi:hypothetical protein
MSFQMLDAMYTQKKLIDNAAKYLSTILQIYEICFWIKTRVYDRAVGCISKNILVNNFYCLYTSSWSADNAYPNVYRLAENLAITVFVYELMACNNFMNIGS